MLVYFILGLLCQGAWASHDETKCKDDDEKSSAVDADGRECFYYDARPDTCGSFDTPLFVAKILCCSCGGGTQISGVHTDRVTSTLPPRTRATDPPRVTDAPRRTVATTSPALRTRVTRAVETDSTRAAATLPTRPPRGATGTTAPRGTVAPITRPTPPPRKKGCFAFDEPEMDLAKCDYKNAMNCVDAKPGEGEKCPFTCAAGYHPPAGGKAVLYMTCDINGKWHANDKCVHGGKSVSDPRTKPTTTSNITKVYGGADASECGQSAWGSGLNMFHCLMHPGLFAVELWAAIGAAVLLIFGLIIGICCCVRTNKSDYPDNMGVQLNRYDWGTNPQQFERL